MQSPHEPPQTNPNVARALRSRRKLELPMMFRRVRPPLRAIKSLAHGDKGKSLIAQVVEGRKAFLASFTRVDEVLKEDHRDNATQELLEVTLPSIDALRQRPGRASCARISRSMACSGTLLSTAPRRTASLGMP